MGIPLADIQRAMTAAKQPRRMAADSDVMGKLDSLIKEIQTDDEASNRLENLVQEARVYLPGRRAELAQLSPSYSKLAEENPRQAAVLVEKGLSNLGRLQGNVPMPIISKSGVRTHTNYRTDEITGQELVVPYMDPSDRRVVLQTKYGREFADDGHNAEPSMMNAMKLMGYDTQWNDTGASGYHGLADLAATKGDTTKKVDVMVRKSSDKQIPVPAYTSLVPILDSGREERGRRGSGAADYVQSQIKERMSRDSVGPVSAVESLVADKVIGPANPDRRLGKLLRSDTNRVSSPEKVYDSLIMPGYSDRTMSIRGEGSPARTPTPPTSIHMMDLGVALNALDSGKTAGGVKYTTNYGNFGNDYERLQVKPYFDVKPEMGVTDVTKTHPLTQQLLDQQTMSTLRVS